MKKIISIASRLFIAAVFTSVLFTNCENFNTSGNMRDKLQEEANYTNAPEIKVSFVIGTKDSGQLGVNLPSTLKKGYPQEIIFRMDEAHYHFREWIAYNNYLTDKQEVVPASQIKIYEPNNQTTKVELLDKGNLTLVTLVPLCDTHPGIVFNGTNLPDNAVLSPVNSYQLVKEENLDVSLKLPEEYGFDSWNFYYKEVSDSARIPVLTPEDLEAYAPLVTEENAEADDTGTNLEDSVEKPARPSLYIYKTEDAPLNTDENANHALALFYKETATESTTGETKNSFIFRLPDNLEEMIYVIPSYYSQPKVNISIKTADDEKLSVKPAGQSVFKIGKDYTVTSTVKAEYGFKNWDFSYNKGSSKTTIPVLTQEKYDANKENEKPSEYFYLTYSDTADSNDACKNATAIIFDNADNTISANSFILRFQKEFNYLLNITPVVYKHPTVNMSIAASDMSKATMKPSETRSLQIGNDFTVNIQTTNEYGYSSWKAYYKTEGKEDTLVNVYTKDTIPPLPIGEYVYVCQGDLEKTKKGELISAITNSLAVIYNNETEVTDNGQTKLNPVIRFFKAPVNDQLLYVEPVLFNHPKVNFKYDLTKATMKPAEQQTLRVGSTLDLTVQTQSAYGFKNWEAWLLDSAAGTEENVPVYSSDNIPESITGNYIYVCKGSIEKTENGEYTDAAKNALAVLYNSDPDVSASGATKVSPTLRMMSAPENDRVLYIQPVLFNHPQVSFSYDDQNKATVKPGDTKTLVVGTDLDVTVQIQKGYGFRKWNAALGSSAQNKTNLNVYTKNSLPSALPENYVFVCEGNLEKTESGEYIDAVKNAAAVIYNTDTETTDNGITKVTSVFRFMKVLDENQGLYIEPELYDQPKVNFTVDTTKATMKPAEQQTVHVGGTVALTVQTSSEYGLSGWTAKLGTTAINVYDKTNIPSSVSGDYVYVCNGDLEKTETGSLVSAIQNSLAVIYNADSEISATGVYKATPTLRLMKAPADNAVLTIEPVLFNHPKVNFAYDDTNKATIKPAETKTLLTGADLEATLLIQNDYGFKKWTAVLGTTAVPVYDKDTLPETTEGNYIYICEGSLEKDTDGTLVSGIQNALAVIYNSSAEETEGGVTKLAPTFRFMKITGSDEILTIKPELFNQPKVDFTVDTAKATLKPTEQQTVHVGGTVALTVQTNSEYGYSGWTAKLRTTAINVYDKTNIPSSVSGDYVYVCNGELEKTEAGSLVPAIQNSLAVIYNADSEISATGVYKATPTLRLMKAPADNAVLTIEPVLFNHPKVNFAYDDTNKATIKPAETKTLLTGADLEATLLIQNDYGFKKWTAVLGTTAVPVYDKDTLPETTEGNYIYICEGSLEKDTDGTLVSGIQNALAVIYNSSAEEAEGGVTKLAPTFRFMKITGSDEILTIKPELFNQPKVDFTVDTAKATLKPTEQQTVHVGGTVALTVQTNSEYGYSGWTAKLGTTAINVYDKTNIPTSVSGDYVYVCNGDLEKTETGSLVSAIQNSLAVIYNADSEISATGVYKATPTLRLMKAPADNAVLTIEPVLFNHPKVNFAYDDTNKATIKPAETKTLLTGADLEATLLIQNDYGFKKWTAALGTTAVPVYDKDTLPETTEGNYIYICEGSLEKDTDGVLVSGIQNALAVIYNSSAEETEGGVTKLAPTFRFMKITGSDEILTIKPELFNQPKVDFTVDTAKATLKPTEQQTVHVGGTVALTVQTNSEYGYSGWTAKLGTTAINVYDKTNIPSSVSGDYVYVCNGDLEKTETGSLVPAIQNSLAVIYNVESEISSSGTYKATPTLRLMKAPANNAVLTIEPVIFAHPKVAFDYEDTNKATIKPAETKILMVGSDLEATLLIQNDYGFKKWTAALGTTAVPVYDKDTIPASVSGNYIYVCKGALEKTSDGSYIPGIQNALAVIYNSSAEETEGGVTKLAPTFRFMKITGNEKVLTVKPELFNQPKVNFTVDTDKATMKPSEQQTVHVGGTVALSVQATSEYGIKGWKAQLGSTALNVYNKNTIPASVSGEYIYVCNGDLEKDSDGSYVSGIKNALAVIYNAAIEVTDKGIYKATPTLRLMKTPENNAVLTIEPDVYAHPKVNFTYNSDRATLKPAELTTIQIGSELDLTMQIQKEYGFQEWKAYLVNETTYVNTPVSVYNKDNIPSNPQEDFIYVAASSVEKVNGAYPSPVNKALAIISNNYEDVSETGTAKVVSVLTFLKNSSGDRTLLLEPVFKTHPKLGFSYDESRGTVRPNETTPVRHGNAYDFTLTTDSDYGFSSWNATLNNSAVNVYDKNSSIPSDAGKYIYICQGAVEMNSSGLYYSDTVLNAVAVVYNTKSEIQSNGSIKLTPSVLFMNGAADGDVLLLNPVMKQHPYVKFQSDSGKYTLSPNGTAKEIIGSQFKLEAATSDKYSFFVKETDRKFSDVFVVKNKEGIEVFADDYFNIERFSIDEKGFNASAYLTPKADISDFVIEAKTEIRPQITFCSPSDNSSDVYKNIPIKFIFSKEFDSDTVFKDYIKLTTQTGYSGSQNKLLNEYFKDPQLSDNKLFLTIRNNGNNLPDMTYITITLDGNIKDSSGICLGNDYSFTFLTGYNVNTNKPTINGDFYEYNNESGIKNDFTYGNGNYAAVTKRYGNQKPFDNLYIVSPTLDDNFKNLLQEQGISEEEFKAQTSSLLKADFYADDTDSGDTGFQYYSLTEKLLQAGKTPLNWTDSETYKKIEGDGGKNYTIPKDGFEIHFNFENQKQIEGTRFCEIGINFNIPVDGVHEFTINALNNLGQTSHSITFKVVRDTQAPEIANYEKRINCNTAADLTVGSANYYEAGKVLEFEPSLNFEDKDVTDNSTCTSLGSSEVYFAYGYSVGETKTYSDYQLYDKVNTRTGTVTLPDPETDTTYNIWLKLKDAADNETETLLKDSDGELLEFNVHKTCPEITDVKVYDAVAFDTYSDDECSSSIKDEFYLSFSAKDSTIGLKNNGIQIGGFKKWNSENDDWEADEISGLQIYDSESDSWLYASSYESNSSRVTDFTPASTLKLKLPDSVSATGSGNYKFTITAEDFFGNKTEHIEEFIVDRTIPEINSIEVYNYDAGAENHYAIPEEKFDSVSKGKEVVIKVKVKDIDSGLSKQNSLVATGLTAIQYSNNGTSWSSNIPVTAGDAQNGYGTYYIKGIPTDNSSNDGKYTLSVKVTDRVGNFKNSDSVTIDIDTTKPVISGEVKIYDTSLGATTIGEKYTNEDVTLEFTVVETGIGIKADGIQITGLDEINSVTINGVSYSSTEWNSVDFRTPGVGYDNLKYVVTGKKTSSGVVSVTATDNAGNISTTGVSKSITFDGTAPVISFFKIYDDSESTSTDDLYSSGSNGDLLIKLELQDAESGLAENGLLFNGITNITYSSTFAGPYSTTIPIINQDTALKTIWIKGSANSITTVEGLEHFCVSVIAKNVLQVESSEKESKILLDTTAPDVIVRICDYSAVQLYGLNNRAADSTNGDVLLEIITSDPKGVGFKQDGIEIEGFSVSEIYSDKEKNITEDSAYTPYTNNYCEISAGAGSKSSFTYYLRGTLTSATTGSGEKTVSVKVTDWLGNYQTVNKTIYIDTEVDSFTVYDVFALKDSLTGDTTKTHYVDESGEISFKVSFNETRYFPGNPVSFNGFTVTGYKTPNFAIWKSSSNLPIPMDNGNYVYYVKGTLDVKDAGGNNFVFSSTFTDYVGNTKSTGDIILPIDTTAPTVTISNVQDASSGNTSYTNGDVKFKITASDTQSGLSTALTYTGISNITYSATENGTYTSTVPYSDGTTTEQVFWVKGIVPPSDSLVDIEVFVDDVLGHTSSVYNDSLLFDGNQPRVFSVSAFDTSTGTAGYSSNGNITLDINVDEYLNGIGIYSGVKNIYVSGFTGDIKYYLSPDASWSDIPESESSWITTSNYCIPVYENGDLTDIYLYVKGKSASTTSYSFKVWAEDIVGNIGKIENADIQTNPDNDDDYECRSVTVIKDNTAPTISSAKLYDTGGGESCLVASNGDITLKLEVKDTSSGISYIQVGGFDTTRARTYKVGSNASQTINANLPTIISLGNTKTAQTIYISGIASDVSDGSPYTITYSAVDAVGNVSNTVTKTIKKDVTGPSASDESIIFDTFGGENATGGSNGDVTVKLVLSDPDAGFKASGITFTGLSNSSYSTDNSTYLSSSSNTIPVDAGIKSITYYVKGTATASDNKYTVNFTFTDKAGNTSTYSKSINVDTTAPTVSNFDNFKDSGTSNPDYTIKGNKIKFRVVAKDTASGLGPSHSFSGITEITYSSDEKGTYNNYVPYTVGVKTQQTFWVQGTLSSTTATSATITMNVNDAAGNSVSKTGTIKFDSHAPKINASLYDYSSNSTSYSNGDLLVKLRITDDSYLKTLYCTGFTGDVKYYKTNSSYDFPQTDSGWSTASVTSSTYSIKVPDYNKAAYYIIQGKSSSSADHSVILYGADVFGNSGSSAGATVSTTYETKKKITLTGDSTAPTFSSESLYDTSGGSSCTTCSNGDVTLSLSVADSASGVQNIIVTGFDTSKVRYYKIDSGNTVTISAGTTTTTIPLSGSSSSSVRVWGTAANASPYSISYYAVDAVGNTSAVSKKTLSKVVIPPRIYSLSITDPENSYLNTGYNVSGNVLLKVNVDSINGGHYRLYFNGFSGSTSYAVVTHNGTKPSDSSYINNSTNSYVNLSSYKSLSDIDIYIKGTISSDSTFTVYAEDLIGNTGSSSSSTTYKKSLTVQKTTNTIPYANRFTLCDAATNVSNYSKTGEVIMKTNIYGAGSSGLNKAYISGFDTSKTMMYAVVKYGSSAPASSAYKTTTSLEIDLASEVSALGLGSDADINLYFKGTISGFSSLNNGETSEKIIVYADDKAGNTGKDKTLGTNYKNGGSVTKDTAGPTGTATLSYTTSQNTITIDYSFSNLADTNGLRSYYKIGLYDKDGGGWKWITLDRTKTTFSASYLFTGLTIGHHYYVHVEVYDIFGNIKQTNRPDFVL